MKYIVVYTDNTETATPKTLLTSLRQVWNSGETVRSLREEVDALLTDIADEDDVSKPFRLGRLFVAFMKKGDPAPKDLFNRFAKKVERLSGPFSLAVLDAVALLERDAYRAIRDFSKPMELPVFMHVHNNELSALQLAPFISTMVRDYVLDDPDAEQAVRVPETIAQSKILALRDCVDTYTGDKDLFNSWLAGLKGFGLGELGQIKWEALFVRLSKCGTLDDFLEIMSHNSQNKSDFLSQVNNKNWEILQFAIENLSSYLTWRRLHPSGSFADFMADFKSQQAAFTRLLKFSQLASPTAVHTGSVFRSGDKKRFLLCITPFCDTAKPKKVNYRYKFLVGSLKEYNPQVVKGDEKKEELESSRHITLVPCRDDQNQLTLEVVQWDFFETEVRDLADPARLVYEWRSKNYDPGFMKATLTADKIPVFEALSERTRKAICYILGGNPGAIQTDEPFTSLLCVREISKETPENNDLGPGQAPAATALDAASDVIANQLPSAPEPMESDADRLEQAKRDLFYSWMPLEGYDYVGTLKREYIQQIINKYLVYHSRAGVSELYLKERPGVHFKLGIR